MEEELAIEFVYVLKLGLLRALILFCPYINVCDSMKRSIYMECQIFRAFNIRGFTSPMNTAKISQL